MRYIKFYIKNTIKWVLYNSLLLSIILFCIFQLYGNINFQYYKDNLEILKNVGIYGNIDKIDMNIIKKLEKIDKFRNINFLLELPDLEHGKDEYIDKIKFSVIYGEKNNILKMGEIFDNNSSGNIIVSPEYFSKNGYSLLDKIKINDSIFTIVGVSNYNIENTFIISYKDYKKLGLKVNGYFLRANDKIKRNDINKFLENARNIFHDETLKIDHPNNDISNLLDEIIFSFIIFVLGLLNMYSLYKFTLYKKANFMNVLLLSGFSKKKIYISEIVSILLTFVFGNIFSILSYLLFNKFILNNIFNINNNLMYAENYIYVFLIYIVFYLLSMLLILINNFTIFISKNIKESNI